MTEEQHFLETQHGFIAVCKQFTKKMDQRTIDHLKKKDILVQTGSCINTGYTNSWQEYPKSLTGPDNEEIEVD